MRTVVAPMIWTLAVAGSASTLCAAEKPVSFARDIQPIFEKSCWSCHGAAMQLSKLDLRSREAALSGGEKGAAIVPGKAEESRLYRRIAGLEKPAMPMDGSKLSPEQISAVKDWINQGASWDAGAAASKTGQAPGSEDTPIPPEARKYWAFQKPVRLPAPAVSPDLKNPIDRFLEKVREAKGLKAAPRADRATLVRRAYLDLIGLPPTPAETAEFLADQTPGAWERLVDKLLASPHYGERWGRHWLDVANYADSSGYEHDYDRPNAWRYRDYVIRAFNGDKPYNVFLKEQIAGDELDYRTNDSMIATGFLRSGPRVAFREADNPERRYDYLDDIIATLGKGILGLSVQCARCHNHKFDPIPQKDYYSLEASIFGYVESAYPLAPRSEAEAYERKIAEISAAEQPLKEEIKKIEEPYRKRLREQQLKRFPENIQRAVAKPEKERTPGEQLLADQVLRAGINVAPRAIDQIMTPEEQARKKALNDQVAALEKQKPAPLPVADIVTDGDYRFAPPGDGDNVIGCPKCRIREATEGSFLHTGPGRYQAPPSYFLVRGDPQSRGALMKPGFITVATYGNPPTEIPPADGHTSGRRRALAEWITSRENPLTSRVMVNRIWAHHFGRGIVSTTDNFGKMGELPTHPELLDWLAVEFMDRGWSVKQMHRLMMTSAAYQMASSFENAEDGRIDSENRYLWRFRIQRLDAEIVRDSVLAASGGINLAEGGPSVFPHLSAEFLKGDDQGIWDNQEDGPNVWRRSVYVYRKRDLVFPMFQVFDLPDQSFCAAAPRNVTTVPTQALTLLNNDFVLRQAKLFADRVKEAAPDDPAKQIDVAYRIALARSPTAKELAVAADLVKNHSLADLTDVLLNLSEFLYIR